MGADDKTKLVRDIRRRAFERRDRLRDEKQRQQDIQYHLDALRDVTELRRSELEAIARDVQLSSMLHEENFFSIKNQVLGVCTISGLVILLAWLFIRI